MRIMSFNPTQRGSWMNMEKKSKLKAQPCECFFFITTHYMLNFHLCASNSVGSDLTQPPPSRVCGKSFLASNNRIHVDSTTVAAISQGQVFSYSDLAKGFSYLSFELQHNLSFPRVVGSVQVCFYLLSCATEVRFAVSGGDFLVPYSDHGTSVALCFLQLDVLHLSLGVGVCFGGAADR